MKKSKKYFSKNKSKLKPLAFITALASASFLACTLPQKVNADNVNITGQYYDDNAPTIGGGDYSEYNDWLVEIGDGSTKTVYNVGNKTAISLKNGATIIIHKNATLANNVGSAAGNYGTGANTIETNSDSYIVVDGVLRKTGTQNSAEAINVHGNGNYILVNEDGLIETEYSAAIWFQNTKNESSQTGDLRNVIDNYGTIRRIGGGSVIGSSHSEGIIFYNRSNAVVDGSISFANGDDILVFEDNSVVTGDIDGGLGINELYLQGVGSPNPNTGANILPGAIKNFSTLTKEGSGRWDVTGSLSGFTIVTVDEGILGLTGNNANYNGTVIINPAGVLEARAQSLPTYAGNLANITNSGIVLFNQDDDGEYIGQIVDGAAGAGKVEKIGTGNVYLNPEAAAGNTYSGGTTIYQGTISLNRAEAIGTGSIDFMFSEDIDYTSASILKGAYLQFLNPDTLNLNNEINIDQDFKAVLDIQAGQVNINNNINSSGSGNLTKKGDGTLVLNGNNSFHELVLTAGNTVISRAENMGSGDIRFEDNLFDHGQNSTTSTLTLNNQDDMILDNKMVVIGTNYTGIMNAVTDKTTTFNGILASLGTTHFEKTGLGKVVFAADANWFAGDVLVSGGHLTFEGNTSVALGAVVKEGTLEINNAFGSKSENSIGTQIKAEGRLEGVGSVSGPILNSGVISPGNDKGRLGKVLTLDGDYIGQAEAVIEIETVLGDDTSETSMLRINGDTTGEQKTSTVKVFNRGGLGDFTTEGIKIIEVNPEGLGRAVAASYSDAFALVSDYVTRDGISTVVGGAYLYHLDQGSTSSPEDGHWYLKTLLDELPPGGEDEDGDGDGNGNGDGNSDGGTDSPVLGDNEDGTGGIGIADNFPPTAQARANPVYNPATVLYEIYPNALLSYQEMGTLEQRVGNKKWADDSTPTSREGQRNGLWARTEGMGSRYRPAKSTYGQNNRYDVDFWRVQIGYDRVLQEREDSFLVGGLNFTLGNLETKVGSDIGSGKLKSHAKGVGATLTWYGQEGLYLDAQAAVTWYDTDIYSHSLNTSHIANGNDGFGYGLSLEVGKKIPRSQNWSLTPQFQLAYTNVDFDDFMDSYQVRVSRKKADSLLGRLGLAVNYEKSYGLRNGQPDKHLKLYGLVDLYQEFKGGTKVDISRVEFSHRKEKTWLGLSVGGTHTMNNGKNSFYAELGVRTSLKNFGDSYTYRGEVGFRWHF